MRKTLQNRKITSILQMKSWGTDKLNDLPTVAQALPAETETDPVAFLPHAKHCSNIINFILPFFKM